MSSDVLCGVGCVPSVPAVAAAITSASPLSLSDHIQDFVSDFRTRSNPSRGLSPVSLLITSGDADDMMAEGDGFQLSLGAKRELWQGNGFFADIYGAVNIVSEDYEIPGSIAPLPDGPSGVELAVGCDVEYPWECALLGSMPMAVFGGLEVVPFTGDVGRSTPLSLGIGAKVELWGFDVGVELRAVGAEGFKAFLIRPF